MATNTANRGYQLPDPDTKLKIDVLRLIAALEAIDGDVASLILGLAGKAASGHGHSMSAITGLVAALAGKLDVGSHDTLANLTDVDVAGVANGMALLRQANKWIPVALQIGNIAGLETALNAKATPADITAAINALVAAAPGLLDTLDELAAALGDDPAFATTVTTALGNRVRVDAVQTFTAAQQGQGRDNIGAGALGGLRNKLINAQGQVNQRGYVNGAATTAANQYTLDRLKVVVSGQSLAWSDSAGVRTFTAPAGGVEQPVLGENILGGDYVLNWTGTATATVNGTAVSKGVTFTLAGGVNAVVRMTGGTFSKLQLEEGVSPTQFEMRPKSLEEMLCYAYGEGVAGFPAIISFNGSSTHYATWHYRGRKRVTPAIYGITDGGAPEPGIDSARCTGIAGAYAAFGFNNTTGYGLAFADAEVY